MLPKLTIPLEASAVDCSFAVNHIIKHLYSKNNRVFEEFARAKCFFSINSNADSIKKILKQVQDDIRYFIMPDDFGPRIGASMVHFDENERIVVDEGPLKGLEGSIIKVDRRKQRAKIQLDFRGSTYPLDLGFEDISRQN